MTPTIEKIDRELAELAAEISRIEVMPAPASERFAAVEADLRACEQLFRERGHSPAAPHPAQQAELQHRAAIGAAMVVDAAKILKAAHQRVVAAHGGEGMSEVDKQRELKHLRTAVLAAACRRELALREVEGDGFLPRAVHAELLVFPKIELERIVAR